MLLVSRYCPFLIASSIFSNVYCIRNDIMSDTILIINLHLINVNYKQSQTHELCQYSNNDHVGGETNVKNNMSIS